MNDNNDKKKWGASSIQRERLAGAEAELADARRELESLKMARAMELKQYLEGTPSHERAVLRWDELISKQEAKVRQAESAAGIERNADRHLNEICRIMGL